MSVCSFPESKAFLRAFWGKRAVIGRLIRFDRPYGTFLLMLPTLWSLLLASGGRPTLKHLTVFILGAFLMRSAGCVANDMTDREYDAKIERTKGRPLASAALSMKEGALIFIILITLSFLLVLTLNLLTILLSFAALFFALLYPFTKRFTYFPQFVLGAAFGFGIILAWTATRNELSLTPFLIFIANLFWAAGYDTIYALMDRRDDIQVGIKSTAVFFGAHSWLAVGFFFSMVILSLWMVGGIMKLGFPYYLALATAGGWFFYQVIRLRKTLSREDLFCLFKSHVWIGGLILGGIALNYHFPTL